MNDEGVAKFRNRKTVSPCAGCRLHLERCICRFIPTFDLKTKLTLVVHDRESKRTTSTGHLAVKALSNSELHIRGKKDATLDLSSILNDRYESYVLYPSEDAVDIESLRPERPVQLIVADGNWRQAGKLHRRHSELKNLTRVRISVKNAAKQNLRREHFDEGYSTLEAIAIAMGVLEGPFIKLKLLELYQHKLKATLTGRGTWKE